jgi:hypothetical protein
MSDLTEARRYSIASLFTNPAFWRGAKATRLATLDQADDDTRELHVAGTARVDAIVEGLTAGKKLTEIQAFKRWLAYAR